MRRIGRWVVLPDDSQTAAEARIVNPKYGDRMARLAALRDAMPSGVSANLNDETINAIAEKLAQRVKGTR